ncbi:flagellar biosynthetic protein FliO [Paraburkholderia sp. GAS82]|uniref:flagellar biosynthetic protein FliO n=1 Tax=Paraburkholderia sp. GAS82 TaxID=3035137 RepID=UPI003D208408
MSTPVHASWLQDASLGASAASSGLTASLGSGSAWAGIDLVRTVFALALCLTLGVGAILLIRRGQGAARKPLPGAGARCIHVVDSARLNPRVTLHLVEYGNRTVLLAVDANDIKLLDSHENAVPEPRA